MIGEEQQDQAALYALGMLSVDEADAFERAMAADPELAGLARQLRETANRLALAPSGQAPHALKARVMGKIAAAGTDARKRALTPAWVPWAIAALLALFCGVLATQRSQLTRELAAVRDASPIPEVAVYSLAAPDAPSGRAAITVEWAQKRQSGLLNLKGLSKPSKGKDYQLWAVDAKSPEPISAGIVRVDENGYAQVEFKPRAAAYNVDAFAISLEPLGGSPKKTGPIVYVGKQ